MRNSIRFMIFLLLFSNSLSLSADTPVKVGIYQNKPKIFTDNEGDIRIFVERELRMMELKERIEDPETRIGG